MTRRHALVWFGIIAALLSAERQAHAQPLTPGNLLVSNLGAGTLSEYTSAGVFVRSFAFPDFEGGFHDLRDIAVSSNGNVQAFNGTFTPQLTTLVPTGPTFTSQPFTGWSTINNISYGGIGNFGSATFVTDMATASPGGPQGIVRFGNGGSPVRFASTNDYQDLTVGGDGLIYALRGGAPSFNVDVFDPNTLGLVRSIPLDASLVSADVRGLAVSSAGSMFAAAWNGTVYAMNSSGTITNSRVTGFSNLTDIDLDNAGRLLVGSRFGNVILTDTTPFTLSGGPTVHVAFTSPQSIPEPTSLVLGGIGAAGFAVWKRKILKQLAVS
jgi:hypothetical protein